MNLRPVPPAYIPQLWAKVGNMLSKALETGAGEYNADQLKVMLVNGQQVLLVVESGEEIKGAFCIAFEMYPNDRIAFVTAVGGRAMCDQEAWKQFEHWARLQGCTKIRGAAYESVARLWRQKFGVESRYLIVEKEL
jgi:hypothetical protein